MTKETTSCKDFSIIVAMSKSGGIGVNGKLPWRLKTDMEYFKTVTIGPQPATDGRVNAVIMGRKTWESIPERFRPLSGRENYVLSKTLDHAAMPEGAHVCSSLDAALEECTLNDKIRDIFVIGGQQVYENAIWMNQFAYLYLTIVDVHDGVYDAHFQYPSDRLRIMSSEEIVSRMPELKKFSSHNFIHTEASNGLGYQLFIMQRKDPPTDTVETTE